MSDLAAIREAAEEIISGKIPQDKIEAIVERAQFIEDRPEMVSHAVSFFGETILKTARDIEQASALVKDLVERMSPEIQKRADADLQKQLQEVEAGRLVEAFTGQDMRKVGRMFYLGLLGRISTRQAAVR